MKAKPQTADPGENHSNGNAGITGMVDFTGQEYYDDQQGDTPQSEAAESRDAAPVSYSKLDNSFNGSGGTSKTIAPDKVKGINP